MDDRNTRLTVWCSSARIAEQQIVDLDVVGSSPIRRPFSTDTVEIPLLLGKSGYLPAFSCKGATLLAVPSALGRVGGAAGHLGRTTKLTLHFFAQFENAI